MASAARTEIPDSEDEPLSSPGAYLADADDKLRLADRVPHQALQGGPQDAPASVHGLAEHASTPEPNRAGGLGADQENASKNVSSSCLVHATNTQSDHISLLNDDVMVANRGDHHHPKGPNLKLPNPPPTLPTLTKEPIMESEMPATTPPDPLVPDGSKAQASQTAGSSSFLESPLQPTTATQIPGENMMRLARTPAETTIAELNAQRAALVASLAALPNFQELIAENEASDAISNPSGWEPTDAQIMGAANKVVKKHIKLLHEYNEMKDVGLGLMGLIADQRGVRIVEVQDEFGVGPKD